MKETKHKQKVLLVHNYYQIPGGEDTVVANEMKLLEKNGHEVVLYTRHNSELKKMNFLQKLLLPFSTVFNVKTYIDIKRIIKEQRIEIVHVHNTLNLISPAVYYAAVKMKTPLLQTIHNFRFLCPGATFYRDGRICEDCVDKGLKCAVKHNCYRNNKGQTIICVISTWIHRHTSILSRIHFITLTEFNRNKLLRIDKINPEHIFVKPNFTFEMKNKRPIDKNTYYYLYVGRIEEIKGVRLLIEAFKKLPDQKLFLAGEGPLAEELKQEVIPNITFLGHIQHDKLLEYISEAKAVILPSQVYEGFPMAIIEAFSMHKAMIVSDIGNNSALIDDGYNGLKFKYDDEDDLVDKIRRFEKQDSILLGENAYQTYLKRYTAEANYDILQKIYLDIS